MVHSVKAKVRKLIAFLKKKYGGRATASGYRDPFKVLVACVLSQRTKEENTARAASALFEHVRSPTDLARIPLAKLERLIKPAGFYRQKARRLKQLARLLLEKYGGKVPASRSELLKLPGVGDKTAAVVLCYGFGKPTIPVDVHVEVVAKRLGLGKASPSSPSTRKAGTKGRSVHRQLRARTLRPRNLQNTKSAV